MNRHFTKVDIESTVTGVSYLDVLQEWLFPRLQVDEPENFIWQQDALVYYASTNMVKKSPKPQRRIATWNVRSLPQCGKLKNLKIEMTRLKIDVLGVAEMRWPDNEDFWSYQHRIHRRKTWDVILVKELGNRVEGLEIITDY
ncbi:hypothetical protein J437_LFUL013788 [Ladona fulva]|uniref:Uncharacterized protein n=1 Tax=Ladona fulva TaxID=123851 RepID=A0A8K0KED3_LADFU|nr:hypothetical protein J437_LFUL013788 [Ladona fulva]